MPSQVQLQALTSLARYVLYWSRVFARCSIVFPITVIHAAGAGSGMGYGYGYGVGSGDGDGYCWRYDTGCGNSGDMNSGSGAGHGLGNNLGNGSGVGWEN